MKGIQPIPYRLAELLEQPSRIVYVPEGEKDCNTLASIGLLGTCNAGGAGKWTAEHAKHLVGRDVIILPDNDTAGEEHAAIVASSLVGIAASIKILRLPDLPTKGDVSDWLQAGGSPDRLQSLSEICPPYLPPPADGPILTCLSDVLCRPVDWLWQDRIAIGRLTLIAGAPGLGKSFLTCDLVSRISLGMPWPDGAPCETGSSLLVCAEDDPGDTIRPRLEESGADLSKIFILDGARIKGKVEQFYSLAQIEVIDQSLSKIKNCRLLVIDPIGSYMGSKTDIHRDNEVRGLLAPLATLAQKHNVSVVMVAHHRKSSANIVAADELAMGSRAFTGISRSVWHLCRDPHDRAKRLLVPGKNNLAAEGSGLSFAILGGPGSVARIYWDTESVSMSADEAMASQPVGRPGINASIWLAKRLDEGTHQPVNQVQEDAERAGISSRSLDRARKEIGAKTVRIGSTWIFIGYNHKHDQ